MMQAGISNLRRAAVQRKVVARTRPDCLGHGGERLWRSLRRSVRRVTDRDSPQTARTGDSTRKIMRIDPPSNISRYARKEEGKTPILEDDQRKRDVERGFKSSKVVIQVTPILHSSFDMDWPRDVQGPGKKYRCP